MRSLRGWMRNLADGLGPPTSSVEVHATYEGDDAELDVTTHQLGLLRRVHAQDGSGSSVLGAPNGHFGWDFEQSPGQIKQTITPSDPQVEYHLRFPDESAQVGKAYHSDLERLAWTGGKDGMVWNAIPGGNDPVSAAGWSRDPTNALSWGVGNGSIASFGPTAGKVTLRPFIAFVGGTVFSVEMGDLEVPGPGGSALPANGGGSDRWDLLYLKVITNPTLDSYGKQTFELLQGIPGAGVPAHPGQTANQRILPMFGLKKAAGATAYSAAYDLRRWLFHPAHRAITRQYGGLADSQSVTTGILADSVLNTPMASSPLVLPPSCGWEGTATLNATYNLGDFQASGRLSVALITEALDLAGVVVPGTGALVSGMINPAPSIDGASGAKDFTFHFPLSTIPPYHVDSGAISDSRTWHTLRFRITYLESVATGGTISTQQMRVHLWPAR